MYDFRDIPFLSCLSYTREAAPSMTGKKVSEKFQKALAIPKIYLYNIKAFRTGADSPHVA